VVIDFPLPAPPLIEVEGLTIGFGDARPVVRDIGFAISPGECLALVGESGSGKSVTARALVGLAGGNARIATRRFRIDGDDASAFDERRWRTLRGARIGFVLQDALGSLDPLRSVGDEIGEAIRVHRRDSRKVREALAIGLLRQVGLTDPERRARQRPRELSGGQRQRALIASAIACLPALLIADEPTTALDAAVQAEILGLLAKLKAQGTAILLISHDLGVVASLADRIAVMREGAIVESGTARAILQEPKHPYTHKLVQAAHAIHGSKPAISGISSQEYGKPLIEARHLAKAFPSWRGSKPLSAVADVSLKVAPGETLGIVGESGCGKTTVARMLLGLETPDRGEIEVSGKARRHLGALERRRIQVVFQDPLGSFDPRYTAFRVIDEALALNGSATRADRRKRAASLFDQVRLDPALLDRRPIELSGGQRQRLAIARALAPEPHLIVCDEPVSALDVSIQADILTLLADLKSRLGLAAIFISHDLGIVRAISDRVAVMQAGLIVEEGPTDRVFADPQHPYTVKLLSAIPSLTPERTLRHA